VAAATAAGAQHGEVFGAFAAEVPVMLVMDLQMSADAAECVSVASAEVAAVARAL
jgi:hypothetical protein